MHPLPTRKALKMANTQEVQQLLDMGFNESESRWALLQVANNVEQAVERLLSGGGGGPEPPLQLPAVDNRDALDVQDVRSINRQDIEAVDVVGMRGITNITPVYEDRDAPKLDSEDNQWAQKSMDWRKKEEQDLSAALEMSMRESRGDSRADGSAFIGGVSDAPPVSLAAEAAKRERDLPCGLRNIGNTCYVNSFLQTLLHIDDFRERILHYRRPSESLVVQAPVLTVGEPEAEQALGREAGNASRREHCINLATELRYLFAFGLFTMRSCIDPTKLLGELVDERGMKLPVGNQEDVGEFMLKFLERLDEGLQGGIFTDVVDEPSAPTSPGAVASDAAVAVAVKAPEGQAVSAGASADSATGEAPAVAPTKDVGTAGAASASPVEKKPSPLQTLFFGQQVQIFSYRDCPPVKATEAKAETQLAVEPGSGQAPASSPELPAADSGTAPVDDDAAKGELVVSEERGEFLQIFLDVKYKDLYSAWEAANCTQVEYTTPSGSSTEASTSIWIERPPKLLAFQLQRVVFDPEKKVQVKLDEPFTFDLTLHVDRFLLPNKTAASAAAARVRELRERREELEKARSRFQEYQGRQSLAVAEVLRLAADCLEENAMPAGAAAAAAAATTGLQLELCDPHRVGAAGVPEAAAVLGELQAGASPAVQLLRSLRDSCLAQEAVLTAEIDRLSSEAEDSHRELRQFPYDLHAIWVHQGIAGSGHYWAYVRDRLNDRWIRYDDSIVTVVAWEDVQRVAVGETGSNTCAYVLVYLDQEIALRQSQSVDEAAVLHAAEASLPQQLLQDIHLDNGRLEEERVQKEEMMAEQELRQHAEAIFQHYAGLIHKWEPQKRTGDRSGNPHDPNMRKFLHDSALLSFQLFLYRLHGEQEVWVYLLTQSIDAQRQMRNWLADEEERILYFLANTLRSQKCYASMLRDKPTGTRLQKCEMQPLEMPKLMAQYDVVLLQAHIIDESLQALKDDNSELVRSVGALAYVWARWNLEAEDKFRQNEVLLIMSTLIYNTITTLVRERDNKSLSEAVLATFLPTCEYFLLLLIAVEWPNSWKQPLMTKIQNLFPSLQQKDDERGAKIAKFMPESPEHRKETLLHHPLTRLPKEDAGHPVEGQEFFNRHRSLYSWLMSADEAISRNYISSVVPSLQARDENTRRLRDSTEVCETEEPGIP